MQSYFSYAGDISHVGGSELARVYATATGRSVHEAVLSSENRIGPKKSGGGSGQAQSILRMVNARDARPLHRYQQTDLAFFSFFLH